MDNTTEPMSVEQAAESLLMPSEPVAEEEQVDETSENEDVQEVEELEAEAEEVEAEIDDTEEDESANDKANQDVLQRIRDYVVSDEAKSSDPVWINSNATIEIVAEEEVEKMTEEEAYESWLKHNEADGGDNTHVVAKFQQEEEKKDAAE